MFLTNASKRLQKLGVIRQKKWKIQEKLVCLKKQNQVNSAIYQTLSEIYLQAAANIEKKSFKIQFF